MRRSLFCAPIASNLFTVNSRKKVNIIFLFTYLTICSKYSNIIPLLLEGGGILVVKQKPGRHPENPKDTMIRVRVDKLTIEKLDRSAEKLNTTRSEIIRRGIDLMDELPEEK